MLFPIVFLTIGGVLASTEYRLPTDVIPEHYDLEILTYLGAPNKFDYDGKVSIETHCVDATSKITLHTKNLTINTQNIRVTDLTKKEHEDVKIGQVDIDPTNDFITIKFNKPLTESHKYRVFIPYSGKLQDSLYGFYRSSYTDLKTKEEVWIGTTQFEPYHARKAFPCFDEPAMKATFDITIGRRKEYNSISNMPLASSHPIKDKEGWYWDKFERSVPMSTYLVAWIVSKFEYKTSEPSKNNNVTFKIWARKDALDQVELARTVGPQALDFFEEFFDIKYPLPKQDMVAVPDFSSGAMENWGLITYREAYLLFDPVVSSTTSQHQVASVISHELAHQWFGNLVTMKWWTDLWLNEGFATFMAGLAVERLFPAWNSLEEEAINNLLNVFSFDSLRHSHPVSVPIGHPSEIDEIFDTISYKKGSFLIRMMSMFLGEETLRLGVSKYLKQHEYGNAEQDDLWRSLTEEAHRTGNLPKNLTVKIVMDTWTLQTGFPLLNVTRNYEKKTASISQERYLKDATVIKDSPPCWWVPLSYTDGHERAFNSSKPKTWLSCPLAELEISSLPSDTWVVFNIKVGSIYKVNYDERNWKLLIDELTSGDYKKIPTLNRVQLLDDASDLAWTGQLKYDTLFELLKYLKDEDEYIPWKAALGNLNALDRQIRKTPSFGYFRAYFSDLVEPVFEKVGGLSLNRVKTERLDTIKHQVRIAGATCKLGVAACVDEAKELFKRWQASPSEEGAAVPKDLRKVIYCTAIRFGGETEWNFLWEQYKKSNVATEKVTILSSLGCTEKIWLLNRYLDYSIMKDSPIRNQDVGTVFSSVASNDVGFYIAKTYLYTNLDKINRHFGMNARRLRGFFGSIAKNINSELDFVEFEKFVKKNMHVLEESKKSIQQSLETAKLNVQWQERHLHELDTLLRRSLLKKMQA